MKLMRSYSDTRRFARPSTARFTAVALQDTAALERVEHDFPCTIQCSSVI